MGNHPLVLAALALAAASDKIGADGMHPPIHPRSMLTSTLSSARPIFKCGWRSINQNNNNRRVTEYVMPEPGTHHADHGAHIILRSALLQIRGGDYEMNDIDDDVSAEDLLDSLFTMDGSSPEPPKRSKKVRNASRTPRPKIKRPQDVDSDRDEDDIALERSMVQKAHMKKQEPDSHSSYTNKKAIDKGDYIDSNSIDRTRRRGGASLNKSTQTIDPKEAPSSMDKRERANASTLDGGSNVHAVWGPKKPPGPPPAKATEEERRADQRKHTVQSERKRLLSNLALSLQDSHVSAIQSLIKGNAAHIPPALFGQTIMQEKSACNEKFHEILSDEHNRREMKLKAELEASVVGSVEEGGFMLEPTFRHIEDPTLLSYWGLTPNAKLYGGAQYHRVLRYYHHLFLTAPLPPITDDEVALLTNGITEVHDASDLMRAVALLVRQKLELVMEDILLDMTRRLLYVMDRQWEMVDYSMALHRPMGKSGDKATREADLYKQHGTEYTTAEADLKTLLSITFHKFAEERAADAHQKCLEDVRSLLRYITWDMGRARKRSVQNQSQNQGFVSQIEIVSEEPPTSNERIHPGGESGESRQEEMSDTKKRKKRGGKTDSTLGRSNRMVARGGAADGSSRKRASRGNKMSRNSRRQLRTNGGDSSHLHYSDEEYNDEMGDLIGGVMNRGKLENDDDIHRASHQSTSLVVSSKSSPIFSGDDEVLNVLLDTVSSTLVPKSDTQAGHTQAAIESLVSYCTDKTRMDISRIIRSKFNTFFLLAFYEDLGPYLRRELDTYLSQQLDG